MSGAITEIQNVEKITATKLSYLVNNLFTVNKYKSVFLVFFVFYNSTTCI